MLRIFKVSVPIPMLLPMVTDVGILATNISVDNPANGDAEIVEIVLVVKVVTPTENELFNLEISVDIPDILTKSPVSKSWFSGVITVILSSDHKRTASFISLISDSIVSTFLPSTSEMTDEKSLPSLSSNVKGSPTL